MVVLLSEKKKRSLFYLENPRVEWLIKEGDYFEPITKVAIVSGKAKNILQGERLALNIVSRCSAIATNQKSVRGYHLNSLKKKHGFKGIIAGTRKTTPGFRLVEKYGMLVGNIDTHRMDLSTMIMLKDNHIWSQGSISAAVQRARMSGGFSVKIEVECRGEAEAEEAICSGADIIMLDNMVPPELHETACRLKNKWLRSSENGAYKFLIEASGGIDLDTISNYFNDDIDVISLGSMTQGVPHVDFSLKIQRHKQ
ncbi:nicotinate-nucleotide diphosphorylase (carboxylating) [Entomophthora muscae]|uniref:Nicotinate-nucleotide diphosphorylase (Carboxylating) n=1 Tax=Entomophthora muscae TaxID=34485 RepID=A0ACC2UUI3_9FUNG|nr:nicotinate-nucleotide diphosphorylase (carboxylating) [Entomophthora muscae]